MNAIYFAFFINLYLAAFNLVPFGPLDGSKVFEANRFGVDSCGNTNDTDNIGISTWHRDKVICIRKERPEDVREGGLNTKGQEQAGSAKKAR